MIQVTFYCVGGHKDALTAALAAAGIRNPGGDESYMPVSYTVHTAVSRLSKLDPLLVDTKRGANVPPFRADIEDDGEYSDRPRWSVFAFDGAVSAEVETNSDFELVAAVLRAEDGSLCPCPTDEKALRTYCQVRNRVMLAWPRWAPK